MTEPLTPVQTEGKLRTLVNAITAAQGELAVARAFENEAAKALIEANTRAAYSPDCPVVKRGTVTVSERDEWIAAHVLDEKLNLMDATTRREIAMDALRARISESQAVQSLNASVRQAYAMAGNHD